MNNVESIEERKQRFAQIWIDSRMNAGKSQEFMAKGMGVSVRTVRNWENGVTFPDIFAGSEWFNLLGENPIPYFLSFLFPHLFSDMTSSVEDEAIERILIQMITECSATEKRELLFLMSGVHGSSWYSLLQMLTAHCHTGMQSRVTAARTILENYEMEAKTGSLVCNENVQPDTNALYGAIEEAKKSVYNGTKGYAFQAMSDNLNR